MFSSFRGKEKHVLYRFKNSIFVMFIEQHFCQQNKFRLSLKFARGTKSHSLLAINIIVRLGPDFWHILNIQ